MKKMSKNICDPKKMVYIINLLNYIILLFFSKKIFTNQKSIDLPEEYDLRAEYKLCPSLNHIRNQYKCQGCWAFSTAEVISDRICINSNGKNKEIISENELLTCCNFCFDKSNPEKGCSGGSSELAFIYWINYGLPTELCKPFNLYEFYDSNNLNCIDKCIDDSKPERYYGSGYRWIEKNENDIMNEIYLYGSVTAGFKLYSDFYLFWENKDHSTIYELSPEAKFNKGNWHSIKIIGWGEEIINEKIIKYWLCANSWGRNKNNDGFFKFKRGENQCEIESYVHTGYINSKILHRNKETMVVFENHFFNFNNLNKDFM